MLSSLPNHQRYEGEEAPAATIQPHTKGPPPSRNRVPHCKRRNDPVERSLAMVREAHQKVLAAMATLEEEIEHLTCT